MTKILSCHVRFSGLSLFWTRFFFLFYSHHSLDRIHDGFISRPHVSPFSCSRKPAQYNVQRARAASAGSRPPYRRHGSQDSLDELAMDDYWEEMEIIQRSGDAEPHDEVQLKVADGERFANLILNIRMFKKKNHGTDLYVLHFSAYT